jgi:hypothetical protein
VHRHHLVGSGGERGVVGRAELRGCRPGRLHVEVPIGERGGQLGGVDVDALAADPAAEPDLERDDTDPAVLRHALGEVRGGVGDDGDGHDAGA